MIIIPQNRAALAGDALTDADICLELFSAQCSTLYYLQAYATCTKYGERTVLLTNVRSQFRVFNNDFLEGFFLSLQWGPKSKILNPYCRIQSRKYDDASSVTSI